MTIFQRFRIWVDEVQSDGLHAGKLLYAVGIFPIFASPMIGDWWRIPCLIVAIAWVAFLLWRLWLMTKTGLIASDVPQGRLIEKVDANLTDDTKPSR